MSNSNAVIWVIHASRTQMEIDAPTTILNPNTKKGMSGIKIAIAIA
jgi:hypothetical protein